MVLLLAWLLLMNMIMSHHIILLFYIISPWLKLWLILEYNLRRLLLLLEKATMRLVRWLELMVLHLMVHPLWAWLQWFRHLLLRHLPHVIKLIKDILL